MAKLYEENKTTLKEMNDVSLWTERVKNAKQSNDDWSKSSGAERFEREYSGNYDIVFHTRNKKIPVPPINDVFSYVTSDIAFTLSREPYLAVNAKSGSTRGAAMWETLLNYYVRELKVKEELEYEIIDKDLVGFGWHKVGYATDGVINGDIMKIEKEGMYSRFVRWRDVVWNIGSTRPPKDCRWMAQRIVVPLDEAKKQFPNARKLEGTQHPDVDQDMYKKSAYKDDLKVIIIWEIWDSINRKVHWITDGLKDKYLKPSVDWPLYMEEFPFLMYFDLIDPRSSRPMSAIAPWEPQVLEEMILMAQAINHAKRWNRQVFYNGGVLDENVMDKFERGDDGAMLRVPGKVGSEDLRFADFGQLPTDFYLIMDRIQAIKRNVNGQPEFVRGGVTKTSTRTVGELELMQQGTKGRQERKVQRLETHIENIGRHMLACLKANFDIEKTIKVTGGTPEEVIEALGSAYNPQTGMVTISPEDIQGEYDVQIQAGSTLHMDKQTRIQIYETVMNTVAQVVAAGPITPFFATLIKGMLRDYDIKELEEAYDQEQQMKAQEQEMKQQEMSVDEQKTKAEAEKREAQASQIDVETAILGQEANIGATGRAFLKRLEKPPKNGAGRES